MGQIRRQWAFSVNRNIIKQLAKKITVYMFVLLILNLLCLYFSQCDSRCCRCNASQQLLKCRSELPGGFAREGPPYTGSSPTSLAALDGTNRISAGKWNTLLEAHQGLFLVTQRCQLARHETNNSCMWVDLRFTAWASYPIRLDDGGKAK